MPLAPAFSRFSLFLVLGCFPCAALCAAEPQPTVYADGYALVWADEFNGEGPVDPASWSPEIGFKRNHELQWFQGENATQHGGVLVIEARQESRPNPVFAAGSSEWQKQRPTIAYTSSSLTTDGKHLWLYGRFEMRARIPTAKGTWPAFWTLGSAREWPACGEIDIMEAYKDTLKFNLVWGTAERWKGNWDSTSIHVADLAPDWAAQYHVWRMDWDAQRIVLLLDGRVIKTTDLSTTINADAEHSNPFHEPHFMLLNLSLGGDAAGDPTGTAFPQRFDIDYVRVYQRP